MRAREFINDEKLISILETASGGSTGAGAIASVASSTGALIRRMPTTPNLFGYVQPQKRKTKKKRKSS